MLLVLRKTYIKYTKMIDERERQRDGGRELDRYRLYPVPPHHTHTGIAS